MPHSGARRRRRPHRGRARPHERTLFPRSLMIDPQNISFRHRGLAGGQRMRRRGAPQLPRTLPKKRAIPAVPGSPRPSPSTQSTVACAQSPPPQGPASVPGRDCGKFGAPNGLANLFYLSLLPLRARGGPVLAAGSSRRVHVDICSSSRLRRAREREQQARCPACCLPHFAPPGSAPPRPPRPTASRRHVAVASGRSGSCVRAPSVKKRAVRRWSAAAGRPPTAGRALPLHCISSASVPPVPDRLAA